MTDLNAEKKRIDAEHKAMKAILGWLADLPTDGAVRVLQHVGIDFGLTIESALTGNPAIQKVVPAPNGAALQPVPTR